jgi:hypothetical protein
MELGVWRFGVPEDLNEIETETRVCLRVFISTSMKKK